MNPKVFWLKENGKIEKVDDVAKVLKRNGVAVTVRDAKITIQKGQFKDKIKFSHDSRDLIVLNKKQVKALSKILKKF